MKAYQLKAKVHLRSIANVANVGSVILQSEEKVTLNDYYAIDQSDFRFLLRNNYIVEIPMEKYDSIINPQNNPVKEVTREAELARSSSPKDVPEIVERLPKKQQKVYPVIRENPDEVRTVKSIKDFSERTAPAEKAVAPIAPTSEKVETIRGIEVVRSRNSIVPDLSSKNSLVKVTKKAGKTVHNIHVSSSTPMNATIQEPEVTQQEISSVGATELRGMKVERPNDPQTSKRLPKLNKRVVSESEKQARISETKIVPEAGVTVTGEQGVVFEGMEG